MLSELFQLDEPKKEEKRTIVSYVLERCFLSKSEQEELNDLIKEIKDKKGEISKEGIVTCYYALSKYNKKSYEKTGDVGKDFTKMYQKIQNTIILDERHLSKSIYNGSINGVIWNKTNNAIKSLLVDNFYYNDDYKEFSHTKLLVKNQYLQYVDNKNEELNPNYQYKCIDYKKRNSKEFCPRILINRECSEKEQDKIIKALDRILDYHMSKNKIDFKVTFINQKTIYKKFKPELKVDNKLKYPQYQDELLYRFFGIEYKNFGSMEMPNIEYFLDKEYLAMPESLGVDSLEIVLEMLHHRGVHNFDEMINRVIEEKQNTIGFKEEIGNDEEDLY